MAKYATGDIVLLDPLYGGKSVIITEVVDKPLWKYATRTLGGRGTKTYMAKDDIIQSKIGSQPNHPYVLERQGKVASKSSAGDKPKIMAYLRTLKAGDTVQTLSKGVNSHVTFNRLIPNGRRYVFSATNANGTRYKFAWEQVVLPAKTA